ncbi:MAG: class I SAM-dependent methyltransferase, partial [Candidatus Thiodiazotropha sp. (ex Lucinoma aequizonata)]|nr:class I SAM-dependent methyltransferase [Candidatus Thiodiazotropha sp. (ex Lucinoma aequizonata)]
LISRWNQVLRSDSFHIGQGCIISRWLGAVDEAGRVLDVGCDAGAWVEIFASCYKSVIGIESSPLMVEAARKRVAHLSNARILQGDGRHGLPIEQFDLIFLGGALYVPG